MPAFELAYGFSVLSFAFDVAKDMVGVGGSVFACRGNSFFVEAVNASTHFLDVWSSVSNSLCLLRDCSGKWLSCAMCCFLLRVKCLAKNTGKLVSVGQFAFKLQCFWSTKVAVFCFERILFKEIVNLALLFFPCSACFPVLLFGFCPEVSFS